MNVVAGCAATTASSASINRSNRGNRGSANDHSGWASSSSSRSLRASTGSKNATGSAMWITIGSPSPPAVSHTSASRSSSGSSRSPCSSWMREAEVLPDLDAARARVCRRVELIHEPARPPRLGSTRRSRDDRTSRTGPGAHGRSDRGSPRSSSPHRPSRFTIASTLAESMSASNAPTSRRRPPAVGRQPSAEVVVRVDRPGTARAVRDARAGERPTREAGTSRSGRS